jgi:hypothetical protein
MCELALAVQRRHVGDIPPRSASSGYHVEIHKSCYQKHTSLLNCRTGSSDISGYHVDFHEGHSTVGEWQACGMARELMQDGMAREWHGNGMVCWN